MKQIIPTCGPGPVQLGGIPGVFPCPLDQWLEDTELTLDDLEDIINNGTPLDVIDDSAHTATVTHAADISAVVTRAKTKPAAPKETKP